MSDDKDFFTGHDSMLEREVARLREADERWGRNHQLVIEERAAALRRVKELEAEVDRQANLISSYEHNIDCARERIASLAALEDKNKTLRAENVEPDWKQAFAAQSRKLQAVLHIPGVKEELASLASSSAGQEAAKCHPSHKNVRCSMDASTYDYVCDDCGATDKVPGGWGDLAKPCSAGQEAKDVEPGHWSVSVTESDGRTYLCLTRDDGVSAALSCRTASANGETIVSQVVKEFAALYAAPIPAQQGWSPSGATAKFTLGQRLTKTKGSSWTGKVVGFYSTSLTPIGYCIESENEPGSVQLYPEGALEDANG